jgi:hypothetical protein
MARATATLVAVALAAAVALVFIVVVYCKYRRPGHRHERFSPLDSLLAAVGLAAAPQLGAAGPPGSAAKAPRVTYPPVTLGGAGCGQVSYARDGTTPEDKKLVRYLAKTAGTFAKYLAATYPTHPATIALLQRFSGDVLLSDKNRLHYQTGCVVIAAPQGTPDRPALVAKVLHLLAHTVSPRHDALFFETQRWFVRVASAELGLDIPVGCSVCCSFQGACKDACPACRWTEACAGPPANCA